MRYNRIFLQVMTALTPFAASAQDVDDMLASTQHVIFVDSLVVNKTEFLNAYQLNPEAGTLQPYSQFFGNNDEPYSIVYKNQLGNKCFFAKKGRLYTSDMIGYEWSKPAPIEGLGRFQRLNYPFMLTDGTTFYFAAIGEEGMGGLDIYVSRYDSESGTYLKAENIGLPFNCEANDYMYVINEADSIGYFATDRRQPDGKVCIYTFIPNKIRQIYSTEKYSEEAIRSRAAINSIADTWGDGMARQEALARIKRMRDGNTTTAKNTIAPEFRFVIDDNHVYTSFADLRNADNRERMKQFQEKKQKLAQLEKDLDKARRDYARTPEFERPTLSTKILEYEKEQLRLQTDVRQLENIIRQTEQLSY